MTGAVPYLTYADAAGAVAWLRGLGFMIAVMQVERDGRVTHAELRRDDVVVMLSSSSEHYPAALVQLTTGQGVYIVTPRVDELFAAAIDGGGTAIFAPEGTAWGTRRARVLDPGGGREWTFGTYGPGGSDDRG